MNQIIYCISTGFRVKHRNFLTIVSISAFISTPDIQIEGKINQEHSSCFLPSMSSNLRGILKVREPCNEINLNQNSYSSVSYARWT